MVAAKCLNINIFLKQVVISCRPVLDNRLIINLLNKTHQTGLLPLPDGFVKKDGGGDADVERIEAAEHRNEDVGVGGASPDGGEAGGLGAHYQGCAAGHIHIIVGR